MAGLGNFIQGNARLITEIVKLLNFADAFKLDTSVEYYNTLASLLSIKGLVDAHTHPVWAGDRVHEFAMKVCLFVWVEALPSIKAIWCTEIREMPWYF